MPAALADERTKPSEISPWAPGAYRLRRGISRQRKARRPEVGDKTPHEILETEPGPVPGRERMHDQHPGLFGTRGFVRDGCPIQAVIAGGASSVPKIPPKRGWMTAPSISAGSVGSTTTRAGDVAVTPDAIASSVAPDSARDT